MARNWQRGRRRNPEQGLSTLAVWLLTIGSLALASLMGLGFGMWAANKVTHGGKETGGGRGAVADAVQQVIRANRGSVVPVAIGAGRAYQLAAGTPPSVGPLRCTAGPLRGSQQVHVELFAQNHVVPIPPGIGLGNPRISSGVVTGAACRSPIFSLDTSGVLQLEGSHLRVGDLARVWNQSISPTQLVDFRANPKSVVHSYVNGVRWTGPPQTIPLSKDAEIVIEVTSNVTPHARYVFGPAPH